MARVFIVRPFGTKQGIDFEAIEAALIAPALDKVGLKGSTTMEIVQAGNIREDMFRLLITADVVVADLSIHNANVFYELGIRHGLRPNATIMIRSPVQDHGYPFDLQTDRYLTYDAKAPEKTLAALIEMLKQTIGSDRVDSPVYQLLPRLKPPDASVLKVVPQDFGEEVQLALFEKSRGKLRLLAHEVRGQPWETEGLRAVGRAQFSLKAHAGAKETFEWLRGSIPEDTEANVRLATIYQKLGDIPRSELAIARVIKSKHATRPQLAEVFALRARNKKEAWRRAIDANVPKSTPEIQEAALLSPDLLAAQEAYAQAFSHDLNAYYPGVNALALLLIRAELAKACPKAWTDAFDEDGNVLKETTRNLEMLKGAAQVCVKSTLQYLALTPTPESDDLLWAKITEADLSFLVSERPRDVAQRYRAALKDAPAFAISSVRDQILLFQSLNIRPTITAAALDAVNQLHAAQPEPERPELTVICFAGHRIDEPGRKSPRFPNTPQAEAEARRRIRDALEKQRAQVAGEILGIAGCASGGDILFHEECEDLKIKTQLYLAVPADMFSAESVSPAGSQWTERFRRLLAKNPPLVLAEKLELPNWLAAKPGYTIWTRNNLWILFNALATSPNRTMLLALWNGQAGDGAGGTKDLVQQVETRGPHWVRIDAVGLEKLI
jgi:hypothetical protein